MKMIDTNRINTGRQFEFDVAKTFTVFFMVVVHVFECGVALLTAILSILLSFLWKK